MTAQPSDLYELLKKIRYDATAIQAKVTDALNLLTELNLPDQPTTPCPRCGLQLRGPRTLAEHLHNSHDGPAPASEPDHERPPTDETQATEEAPW